MTSPAGYGSVPPPALSTDRIVIGVDGTDGSAAALRWAVRQAEGSGAPVEAVYVYAPSEPLSFVTGHFPATTPVDRAIRRENAQAVLRERVAAVVPPAEVRTTTAADPNPSKALLEAARGASMLVVGAHRHHGLGVLLGSTATSCVRNARCPVVVVPADWAAADPTT